MNGRTICSRLIFNNPFSSFSTSSSSLAPLYDLTTCISFLQQSAHQKNLSQGKQIHSYMLAHNFLISSPLPITSLINMYSKNNRINLALNMFDEMPERKNVFVWNAMISGFVTNGDMKNGFELYKRMREEEGVFPDRFTFPCVIKACLDVLEVRKINGLVFKLGLDLDCFIGSALVNCYLKFGAMKEAKRVFEELPLRDDVVLWNAMINGYAQIGKLERVLEIFRRMCEEGVVPNRFTVTGVLSVFAVMGELSYGKATHGFAMRMGYGSGVAVLNALVDMYGKCKRIEEALRVFEMIDEKDIFSWNSILTVHEQSGDHDGTLRFFNRMLRAGVVPDLVTVTTVLPACAHLAALMHGKEIHGSMIVNGLGKDNNNRDVGDAFMNNAVMDMYAKCGSMLEAQLLFDKMIVKDVASWNIMIKGYGMHGYGAEALDLFCRMCETKLKPDEVTFVGILSACSHSGFLSQGRDFLAQMESKYCVIPTIEHYTCVIDMLGRAGKLEEAHELVLTMPIEDNPVVWRAFLASCRLHGNKDLAEVAGKRVFELEPEHCGSYVLISNIFGEFGQYEEVSDMRHIMVQMNVKKMPGCSWIELKNGVHMFVSGDRTHPDAQNIYSGLNSLTARLREPGYVLEV